MTTKQRLRSSIRAERALYAPGSAASSAAGFTSQLISMVDRLSVARLACFVGVGNEPNTAPFIDWAVSHGISVLLPRSLPDRTLEWVDAGAGGLVPGAFGIPEPSGPALGADALCSTDLVLIPAAAVDRSGTRLGWGLGYYDRELAELRSISPHRGSVRPPIYAVVFDREIVDTLPAEPHDVPVDGAVSELRAYEFS